MRLRRTKLRWFDVMVVTVLMFAMPIVSSTIALLDGGNTPDVSFDSEDNIGAGLQQAVMLLAAGGYLALRRFDFTQWNIKPSWRATIQGICIFLAVGAGFDLVYFILERLVNFPDGEGMASEINASLLGYSLLNSFYEEVFFLGVCLSVAAKYQIHALFYSLMVRFSFHTYMGLATASMIGFGLGLVFYYVYRKLNNMYPLILAHVLGDIFGVSALGLLLR